MQKKTKRYGHLGRRCKICGKMKPHRDFSKEGRKRRVCKECWPRKNAPKWDSKVRLREKGKWIIKRKGYLKFKCVKCQQQIQQGQLVFYYHEDKGRKSRRWYECLDCAIDKKRTLSETLKEKYNLTIA